MKRLSMEREKTQKWSLFSIGRTRQQFGGHEALIGGTIAISGDGRRTAFGFRKGKEFVRQCEREGGRPL